MAIYDKPYKYDAEMENTTSSNKIRLWINNREIPYMSSYSYYDLKSYFKSPQRSANGKINNLNSYATFLTPSLQFYFEKMPIGAYRVLMKLIKEFNEFTVTAYDIVEDMYVTRKMYFEPKDYPDLFTTSLETKMVNKETFTLIGTNEDIENLSLIYNSNGTSPVITSGIDFAYGEEIQIGDYNPELGLDPNTFTKTGYKLDGWIDGNGATFENGVAISGTKYYNDEYVTFTVNKVLYANWVAETKFVISFDYQGGSVTPSVSTKEVQEGELVGELPEPTRTGYIFMGWYSRSKGQGDKYTSNTVYTTGNKTLYAYWIGDIFTVKYGKGNENATGTMPNEEFRVGSSYTLKPNKYTLDGYEFYRWVDNNDTEYKDNQTIQSMPNMNLDLVANWRKQYTLTYIIDEGTSVKQFQQMIYYVEKPITPSVSSEYLFAGWYTDSEFKTPAEFPMELQEDTKLYAKLTRKGYFLSFNANGGHYGVGMDTQFLQAGQVINLPKNVFFHDIYTFKGWSTSKNSSIVQYQDEAQFIMPENDVILYAVWGAE